MYMCFASCFLNSAMLEGLSKLIVSSFIFKLHGITFIESTVIYYQSPPDERLWFSYLLANATNTVMQNLVSIISRVQESLRHRSGASGLKCMCIYLL